MSVEIKPIFAAFEYDSADHARATWRTMRDDRTAVKGISAWVIQTPDRRHSIIVLLGEDQARVDAGAELAMKGEGCLGNYILSSEIMDACAFRRYGEAARAWARGEKTFRQERSYGSGVPVSRLGEIVHTDDAPPA